jgi:hypothetical protein
MNFNQLFKSKSLFIGITNYSAFLICSVLLASPLGSKPGAIHPLLVVPFFYLFISIMPAIAGFIIGAFELKKLPERNLPIWGLIINGIYAGIFIISILVFWPVVKSV